MHSDFALVRQHLELAWLHLNGMDHVSQKTRATIDLLIEATAEAEHSLPGKEANLIPFVRRSYSRRS
jgi:hypothetical protein